MPDDVQSKVKKIPPWAWFAVAAVVGYLAYKWYENYKANQAANAGVTTGTSGALPGETGSSIGTSGVASNPINSFADWLSSAVGWATSNGYDPATAYNAVQDYQAGNCLNPTEYSIIDGALGSLGFPPGAPSLGLVECQSAVSGGSPNGTTTTTPSTLTTPSIVSPSVPGGSSVAPPPPTPAPANPNPSPSTILPNNISSIPSNALAALTSAAASPGYQGTPLGPGTLVITGPATTSSAPPAAISQPNNYVDPQQAAAAAALVSQEEADIFGTTPVTAQELLPSAQAAAASVKAGGGATTASTRPITPNRSGNPGYTG